MVTCVSSVVVDTTGVPVGGVARGWGHSSHRSVSYRGPKPSDLCVQPAIHFLPRSAARS